MNLIYSDMYQVPSKYLLIRVKVMIKTGEKIGPKARALLLQFKLLERIINNHTGRLVYKLYTLIRIYSS